MGRNRKIRWKTLKYTCSYNKSKMTKMIIAVAAKTYFIWKTKGMAIFDSPLIH